MSKLIEGNEKLERIYNRTKENLNKEISAINEKTNAINSSMLNDAFQISTNRKIIIEKGGTHQAGYGISNDGEKFDHLLGAEAWAEFFSAKINNDSYNIEANAEWLPETAELLDEYADYLLDYYYDYYKNVYDYGVR